MYCFPQTERLETPLSDFAFLSLYLIDKTVVNRDIPNPLTIDGLRLANLNVVNQFFNGLAVQVFQTGIL